MSRPSLLEIPSGVQCFFGKEAQLRREVERRVASVFRGWSYEEIVLPLFDFDDVFSRGSGPAHGGVYRFIGRDGEVMALRPDFTALVAKVVVSRLSQRSLPLRLFYSGEVLRYQPPRAGQQEELFQIGLEHLGDGVVADIEVLLVAHEALTKLGIDDARWTVGHVGFVLGLLEGMEETEKRDALDAIRHRDRNRLAKVAGQDAASRWIELLHLSGGSTVLEAAERLVGNDMSASALERLQNVERCLHALGLSERFQWDLGEVRGFDYYTGLVFEVHAPGAGLELGGGGRYDSLVSKFGADIPAVGFYLSLDRIAELLAHRDFSPSEDQAENVTAKDAIPEAFGVAMNKRRQGLRVRIKG
jgi:ATP phosphoribosyltransferase regulatory subunit